jgi:hypothetical protein
VHQRRDFINKVRDLVEETSIDYDKDSPLTKEFFSSLQNKLLYAQTGKTAAELIIDRAGGNKLNMGLITFEGSVVRKKDIEVAKNYLNESEVKSLNRLVNMFLDFAEDRAARRTEIILSEWGEQTEKFLEFNERDILQDLGKKSRKQMLNHTSKEYTVFEKNRNETIESEAEEEYLKDLETTLKEIEKK